MTPKKPLIVASCVSLLAASALLLGQGLPIKGGATSDLATVKAAGTPSISSDVALVVDQRPPEVLGCYSIGGQTSGYTGLAANTPLFSARWGDASGALAVIKKFMVKVMTTTATTVAAVTERQLIVARSFTASDTGGTQVVLTGNNLKRRTSQATSLFTDMRFGTTISAGTRTLDANPVATAIAWTPLLFTGMTVGGSGGVAVAAASASPDGSWQSFLDTTISSESPIILAQNEGIIMRLGAAEPTTAVQQTFVNMTWCEVSAY